MRSRCEYFTARCPYWCEWDTDTALDHDGVHHLELVDYLARCTNCNDDHITPKRT